MSLLKGMTPPVKIKKCYVAETASTLSKEDAAILLEAIANPAWSINALVEALAARGVALSRTVIERHRKGKCRC